MAARAVPATANEMALDSGLRLNCLTMFPSAEPEYENLFIASEREFVKDLL
jgi:hypothetical protein